MTMKDGIIPEQAVQDSPSVYVYAPEAPESGGGRGKLASWMVIASSWVFTLLIMLFGFSIVGILELFGFSEDVSW